MTHDADVVLAGATNPRALGGLVDAPVVGWWWSDWVRYAIGNLAALNMSRQILGRGIGMWSVAAAGLISTTLDDALTAVRIRLSCRTVGELLSLERDLTPRAFADFVARSRILGEMALQTAGEAAYPLQRRLGVVVEAGASPCIGRS